MDLLPKKTSDKSRFQLFGLLTNCIFYVQPNGYCPLAQLRDDLTLEEKFALVMGLRKEEVNSILEQLKKCSTKECYSECAAKSSSGSLWPFFNDN